MPSCASEILNSTQVAEEAPPSSAPYYKGEVTVYFKGSAFDEAARSAGSTPSDQVGGVIS